MEPKSNKRARVEFSDKKEKTTFHLWGVLKPYKSKDKFLVVYRARNNWGYIKECTPDRRALTGVDTRIYSQLEVRSSRTGKCVKSFIETDGYHV